jgi:hypothetical protein
MFLVTRFSEDVNVPPPQSLLLSPTMAYVVEIVFHALPLALLLAWSGRSAQNANTAIVTWPCIVFVSSLEPVLVHLRFGASAYVGAFVFVFTVVELYVFRRYDFISTYAFRLVYYLWWHITWGYVRLQWLGPVVRTRRHAEHAHRWIWIRIPAWALAMAAIFRGTSVRRTDWAAWSIGLSGLAGGALGGVLLSAISGVVARDLRPWTNEAPWSLQRRVSVVTGANSRLGYEVALGLARLGSAVVLMCRRATEGERVRKDILAACRRRYRHRHEGWHWRTRPCKSTPTSATPETS